MKKIVILLSLFSFLCSFRPQELTWVAIGDSFTYLNDHTDETGNRVTKGYLTQTVENFPGMHYINKGYNGWTSGNIAERINDLGLVKADLYTILLGTNDWWQGRNLGTLADYKNNQGNNSVYGSFRIIINKIRSLNPRAKIVLITPMQRTDFVYIKDSHNNSYSSYKPKNGRNLEAFANAIDSIGELENIRVIDLYHNNKLKIEKLMNFKRVRDPQSGLYKEYKYPQSIGIPFDPDKDEYPYPAKAINLAYDGLHPSDKGNQIIAKCISKVFKDLLGR